MKANFKKLEQRVEAMAKELSAQGKQPDPSTATTLELAAIRNTLAAEKKKIEALGERLTACEVQSKSAETNIAHLTGAMIGDLESHMHKTKIITQILINANVLSEPLLKLARHVDSQLPKPE